MASECVCVHRCRVALNGMRGKLEGLGESFLLTASFRAFSAASKASEDSFHITEVEGRRWMREGGERGTGVGCVWVVWGGQVLEVVYLSMDGRVREAQVQGLREVEQGVQTAERAGQGGAGRGGTRQGGAGWSRASEAPRTRTIS